MKADAAIYFRGTSISTPLLIAARIKITGKLLSKVSCTRKCITASWSGIAKKKDPR